MRGARRPGVWGQGNGLRRNLKHRFVPSLQKTTCALPPEGTMYLLSPITAKADRRIRFRETEALVQMIEYLNGKAAKIKRNV